MVLTDKDGKIVDAEFSSITWTRMDAQHLRRLLPAHAANRR